MGYTRVEMAQRTPALSTVSQAINLLNLFSLEEPLLGTSELARRLKLPKSTTHRLVTTLAQHGFLRRVDGGRYRLGLKLFALASLVQPTLELREVAAAYLRQLSELSQETIHLAVRDGLELIYIDKIESTQTIRMYSQVGRRGSMHSTGVGKAILAFERGDVIEAVLEKGLHGYTSHTITDPLVFRRELEQVRRVGYAIDHGETEDELRCVAAPVFDHTQMVVCGISVAGPAHRMAADRLRQLATNVIEIAARMSAELGYRSTVRTG